MLNFVKLNQVLIKKSYFKSDIDVDFLIILSKNIPFSIDFLFLDIHSDYYKTPKYFFGEQLNEIFFGDILKKLY